MLNITYEISRTCMADASKGIGYTEEFFREYNFIEFQREIRKKLRLMVVDDVESKDVGGDDFNAFLLT